MLFERPGDCQRLRGQADDHLPEGVLSLPDAVDAHGVLTDGVRVEFGDAGSASEDVEVCHDPLLAGVRHEALQHALELEVEVLRVDFDLDLVVERRVDLDEPALHEREREAVDGLEHDALGAEGLVDRLHPGEPEVSELELDGVDEPDVREHRRSLPGVGLVVVSAGLRHEFRLWVECLRSKPMRIHC